MQSIEITDDTGDITAAMTRMLQRLHGKAGEFRITKAVAEKLVCELNSLSYVPKLREAVKLSDISDMKFRGVPVRVVGVPN